MQLRSRIILLFSLSVAAVLLVFSTSVYVSFALFRKHEFRDRLRAQAYAVAALFFDADEMDLNRFQYTDKNRLPDIRDETIQVYDKELRLIYSNVTHPPELSDVFLNTIRARHDGYLVRADAEFLGISYPYHGQEYRVVLSAYDHYGFSKLNYLAEALGFAWVICASAAALLSWYFARSALRPLHKMADQAERISGRNLNLRLPPRERSDELGQLTVTFNHMLDRLEEAFRAQRDFVAHASHEIRTPLSLLNSQIEIALLKDRTSDEYRQALEQMHQDVRGLTSLTNSLLTLTKVSAEAISVPFTMVEIDDLLWQTRHELVQKHPEYSVSMTFGEIAERDAPSTVQGNEALLRSAFLNLMENACKYSADHRCHLFLRADRVLEVRVQDHGIGIPTNDLAHLFKPFFRASNAQPAARGHGIGLALVQKIIDLHGGSIAVNSTLGQGTTFTVLLPLADVAVVMAEGEE
ncbi:Signal transduction histidine kinase [Catalinimonas alkaloidigena]|uniref:histidine kinase n=1 Tax=Catalinimonas alkaloidigena TaxID=1075417 RepID=A0A1G9PKX5_9BACT|nr:sensor histidine kinase [Catalinimonas alkaloidigena]SDL98857.1 Signal transduction histidine kinase [Catalinimonas alkaloidigena]